MTAFGAIACIVMGIGLVAVLILTLASYLLERADLRRER